MAGQRSMTAKIRQMTADDGLPLFTLTVRKNEAASKKESYLVKILNDIKI